MKICIYKYKCIYIYPLFNQSSKFGFQRQRSTNILYISYYPQCQILLGLEQDPRLQQKTTGPGVREAFIFLIDKIPKNPPAEATTWGNCLMILTFLVGVCAARYRSQKVFWGKFFGEGFPPCGTPLSKWHTMHTVALKTVFAPPPKKVPATVIWGELFGGWWKLDNGWFP